MAAKCRKHRWRPLREQPTDTTDTCPTCQTERCKDREGRATYRYPPGYERQRVSKPIIVRITKDKPPGEAFIFCFEGQLHAQSEPIPVMGGSIMCAAGPCACGGDRDQCRHRDPRHLHTIRDHHHERCLETARSLVAEAESLPRVSQDANGNVTIVECMLLGEELVPHARRAIEAAEPCRSRDPPHPRPAGPRGGRLTTDQFGRRPIPDIHPDIPMRHAL